MFNCELIKKLHDKENKRSEIHAKIGISKSNYSQIMNGNVKPTVDTLEKIASFFGKNIGYFFDEPDASELETKVIQLEKENAMLNEINKGRAREIETKDKLIQSLEAHIDTLRSSTPQTPKKDERGVFTTIQASAN